MENRKNYYELLGVAESAVAEEVEQAYREARRSLDDASLATYSLYSDAERKNKAAGVEAAYETLKDSDKRRSYDAKLFEYRSHSPAPAAVSEDASPIDEALRSKTTLREKLEAMDPDSVACEQYKVLYTRVEEACIGRGIKTIAMTSAIKGEGKTTTSLNLAYVMAESFGKKTLLVESDLRNPQVSGRWMEMGKPYGLVDVLEGTARIADAVDRVGQTRLHVLPARAISKNSAHLLGSGNMKSLMSWAKDEFDYVLLDSPPVLPIADMSVINRNVDGVVLVARSGLTTKDLVSRAYKSLPTSKFLGLVFNGVRLSPTSYYY